ncbi:MAG: hypothetical protein LUD18_01020 [Lachnospiraceae bacterium]|nr:hypothetical protein [Lachnospiraceae bacterium]
MEDTQIIRMYELRNEDAVLETSMKYQNYCYKIAWNILKYYQIMRRQKKRNPLS